MASATRKVRRRRLLKKFRAAKGRKNHLRNYGTTAANLPLNVPTDNEVKQSKK
jgi:hypothetical protein